MVLCCEGIVLRLVTTRTGSWWGKDVENAVGVERVCHDYKKLGLGGGSIIWLGRAEDHDQ